jgi:hypothetical protein
MTKEAIKMAEKHNEFLEKIQEGIQVEGFTVKDPLIINPVYITDAKFEDNQLILTLSQSVNQTWIDSLSSGGCTYIGGYRSNAFEFRGNKASVGMNHSYAADVTSCFKTWIQNANSNYPHTVIARLKKEKALKEEREKQESEKKALEAQINEDLKKLL